MMWNSDTGLTKIDEVNTGDRFYNFEQSNNSLLSFILKSNFIFM